MKEIGKRIKQRFRQKAGRVKKVLNDDAGLSVVEMILILVVIIALVLIFKTQLISLVNSIFQKITSESAGI